MGGVLPWLVIHWNGTTKLEAKLDFKKFGAYEMWFRHNHSS